ncbi:MAG: rRNA pseudouridine synthase [Methylotenera sp.]|nr:rRNA pseudouridine synthase [Methylotenera sp.]
MTTLKLTKNPSETPVAKKSPVRRVDPAKRDRTVAPPKVAMPARDEKVTAQQHSEHRENFAPTASKAGQRNHRHDGTMYNSSAHGSPAKTDTDTRPTAKLYETRNENRNETPKESKPAKPHGVDTRTTPRASREEPQYRQAPRRGGKVRDGYDAETPTYGAAAKAAYQSTTTPTDQPRLSKVMAERGICSRREADEWIANGWVMVNGIITDTLGSRINPDAEIVISSYAYETQAESVTIILHKPVGYVSGQAEDGYQPAIVLVHPENQWEDDPLLHTHQPKEFERRFLHGLAPAGRLDIDSTGMLVLTQDGRIARHLIGEDSNVEKEYLVRVEGELSDADMKRLNFGLSLDGDKLKPAKVSWQNEDQLRFVLREGKKRQIRRMCEMVGLHVVGLKRVRIGSISLGKLPVGEWRYLRPEEKF